MSDDVAASAGTNAKEGSAANAQNVNATSGKLNEPIGEVADGDSEAETLIESPEKKKNIVVGAAPRLQAAVPTFTADTAQSKAPGSDSKTRKRKRTTAEPEEDIVASPKSSRRSSPLSSPHPHRSDDSDTDASKTTRLRTRNGGHGSDQENTRRTKLRRRRPSDIVPGGSAGADGGRRETRSATYPRHSSADRSVSPKREHRRVASTQIGRKGRPLNINTKRNFSSDRHSSSSSSSPPRTRPQLQKRASVDHDMMSPAKQTGPRKHTDKNGRTYLARACNNNDLAAVRARFAERPQDLNIADHAHNTPLQIAALEGSVDIVKFLLENKCEVDTRNVEKDTPLIDAVENGHLEVVRLLLEFGANPRLGNQHGDEPYELVRADGPDYEEIRRLIADAKENPTKRRKSDDQGESGHHDGSSRAASAASLRDSPPLLGPRSPPAQLNRRRTGRSESTRNDLLWQANTQENLARLAGKGDVQGVANILNVLTRAETESVIAAAKAGHEEVLQLLLGMGSPDPDPEPSRSADLKSGYNTPMLAAVGRGNPDVVQLLVNQSGFDPTRLYQGKKYYELSQERRGVDWQKEHDILKTAYEKYTTGKSRKHGSPRKSREQAWVCCNLTSDQLLLGMGNPDPDPEPSRSADLKSGYNTPMLAAVGRGNPDVVQLLVNQSGFDPTRLYQGKKYYELSQERRGVDWQKEHDILKTAYEKYATGKSRKHGSPRKSRDMEKERPRRKRESSSPIAVHARGQMQSPAQSHKSLPGKDSAEKHRRQLTRDRLPPDRSMAASSDREPSEQRKTHQTRKSQSDLQIINAETTTTQKRRKLITGKEHRSGKEHRRRQSFITDGSSEASDSNIVLKEEKKEKAVVKRSRDSLTPDKGTRTGDTDTAKLTVKKRRTVLESSSPEVSRPIPRKKLVRKPSGDSLDVMQGVSSKALSDIEETSKDTKSTAGASNNMDKPQQEDLSSEKSNQGKGDPDLNGQSDETAMDDILASDPRPMESDEPPEKVDELMEEQVLTAEPSEVKEVDIADAPVVQEALEDFVAVEERKVQEEAARKAAEEAAEEIRQAEELSVQRRAEEDAAARKKEEEERREKVKREAEERQRRLDEHKRREFLEQERQRREALPSLLCKCALLLDQNDGIVKSQQWLTKFLPLFTVKTRQLDPNCLPELQDEEWIANFQVAGLLATKDLNLRQYTSLEKRPVTNPERDALWKVARNMLAFDYDVNAFNTTIEQALEREIQTRPKFDAMAERQDLWWVKLSDFEEQIFRHPHLHGLHLKKQRISVQPPRFSSAYQQHVKPASPPLVNGVSPYASSSPSVNGVFQNGTMHGHGHGYFQR